MAPNSQRRSRYACLDDSAKHAAIWQLFAPAISFDIILNLAIAAMRTFRSGTSISGPCHLRAPQSAGSPDPGAALVELRAVFHRMKRVFARESAFGADGFTQSFEAEPFSNRGVFGFTALGGFFDTGKFGGIVENGVEQKWLRRDTIYLSAFYDVTTDDDRIQTIVHELAHFVSQGEAITDHAYGDHDGASMARLTTRQRLHNAESIGNFAFESKFGREPAHKTN